MNYILQISLMVVSSVACACSIALLVFSIVNAFKGKKRISKEERAKMKEESARKQLTERINKLNAELSKINKK